MLVSAPELIACEVTTSDTTGWTVVARTVELVSVPGLVAIKGVLSDSVWKTLGVVLGKIGLVFAGWVIKGTLVSGSPEEMIRVETVVLVFVQELKTGAGVIAGLLNMGGFVLKTDVLVSTPGLVAKKDVISKVSCETPGVVIITPVVLVLAVLLDVLRSVSIPKEEVDTLVVKVAVVVVCTLSVPPVGSPVSCGIDTEFEQNDYHLLNWQELFFSSYHYYCY